MAQVPEAYIYEAIRTPRGRGKPSGALYEVKPISLVVGLILLGVAKYVREYGPWRLYLQPTEHDVSMPHWLARWKGDGIIGRITDPAAGPRHRGPHRRGAERGRPP